MTSGTYCEVQSPESLQADGRGRLGLRSVSLEGL